MNFFGRPSRNNARTTPVCLLSIREFPDYMSLSRGRHYHQYNVLERQVITHNIIISTTRMTCSRPMPHGHNHNQEWLMKRLPLIINTDPADN